MEFVDEKVDMQRCGPDNDRRVIDSRYVKRDGVAGRITVDSAVGRLIVLNLEIETRVTGTAGVQPVRMSVSPDRYRSS
ncbi:MAG: hypothetical protein R3C49_06760 [Planctomycetaceae bacterium]